MKRFFIVLLLCTTASLAQATSNGAKEYWLCFDQNYRVDTSASIRSPDEEVRLTLCIVSEADAEVSIDIPRLKFHVQRSVQASKVLNIEMPPEAMISQNGLHSKAAIHILSTKAISVSALNHRFQTTDSYGALSVNQLGTEYVLAGFEKLSADLRSQASVVATEDNTVVDIDLNAESHVANEKSQHLHAVLNAGDVYHLSIDAAAAGSGDISGSRVKASKKVAVFSGHSCAYVPHSVAAGNFLVEQLHPLPSLGTEYLSQDFPGRTRYSLKLISTANNTSVQYMYGDGMVRQTLSAGQVLDIPNVRGSLHLRCSEPVQVMQFSHGYKDIDSVGDPCMIQLRAVSNYAKSYTVLPALLSDKYLTSAELDSWKHYALICVPTDALKTIRLHGNAVDLKAFSQVDAEYSVGSILIEPNSSGARIECAKPFSLLQYGYGSGPMSFDAYGHGW